MDAVTKGSSSKDSRERPCLSKPVYRQVRSSSIAQCWQAEEVLVLLGNGLVLLTFGGMIAQAPLLIPSLGILVSL